MTEKMILEHWPVEYAGWASPEECDARFAVLVLVEKGDLDAQTAARKIGELSEAESAVLEEARKWAGLYAVGNCPVELFDQEELLCRAVATMEARREVYYD